jgi:hypothetical protein
MARPVQQPDMGRREGQQAQQRVTARPEQRTLRTLARLAEQPERTPAQQ